MISYFDTSVLLPALIETHELHEASKEILYKALKAGPVGTTTMHAYAELYNNLTRPTKHKIHLKPSLAADVIINKIGEQLTIIELTKEDYENAVRRCARLNLVSGVIYDALHLEAALKAEAEILYTDNLRDFTRLVTEDDPIKIVGVR